MTECKDAEYRFFSNIIFDVKFRKIIDTRNNKIIALRETNFRLLRYLTKHASGRVVTDSELMLNIWTDNGLVASPQRLLKVVANIKAIITSLDGAGGLLILRVREPSTGELGYILNSNYLRIMVPHCVE